jgi:DNA-binding beta-propeller fold protein YncE
MPSRCWANTAASNRILPLCGIVFWVYGLDRASTNFDKLQTSRNNSPECAPHEKRSSPSSPAVIAGLAAASVPINSFAALGNLYDADFFGNRIVKITPAGTASIFASGLALPRGLAFDRAGNLFVANAATSASTIVKITPAGVKSTFATGFNSATHLAFDASGNLFVTDFHAGTIVKITPAGVKSTFASGLSGEDLRDRGILDAEEIPEIETMKAKIAESDAALEERHQ